MTAIYDALCRITDYGNVIPYIPEVCELPGLFF